MSNIHEHVQSLKSKPLVGLLFFVLVAVLSSAFSSLGMEGIFFAVLGAALIIGGGAIVLKVIGQQAHAMVAGKPNRMDHMLAPSGYRRRRYAETVEQQAAQSIVVPTPNRPLVPAERIVDARPSRSDGGAISTAVVPQRIANKQQFLNACLELASDFNPPHTQFMGRAILGVGQRGSGKTNAAALVIEQIGKFPVPMAIFDYEEDYTTLPEVLQRCVIAGNPQWEEAWRYKNCYWQVDEENAEDVGYEILEQGVQLVLEIGTYETLEEAAHIMSRLIKGMFIWANERDPKQRVPALILLDEAQHFLPENNGVSNIQKEAAAELLKAFMDLNARGRKRGLTPAIFTQRIQQIKKAVITGSEIYFLMRQTTPGDLELYEEILGKSNVDRRHIASFQKGDAIIFEGGESFQVHFDERQSEHRGKTPDLNNAMLRYQVRPTIQKVRGIARPTDIDDEDEEDQDQAAWVNEDEDDPLHVRAQPQPVEQKPVKQHQPTDLERGVNAWREGATSIDKLAAALHLTSHQARKLKPLVEAEIARLEALENE